MRARQGGSSRNSHWRPCHAKNGGTASVCQRRADHRGFCLYELLARCGRFTSDMLSSLPWAPATLLGRVRLAHQARSSSQLALQSLVHWRKCSLEQRQTAMRQWRAGRCPTPRLCLLSYRQTANGDSCFSALAGVRSQWKHSLTRII